MKLICHYIFNKMMIVFALYIYIVLSFFGALDTHVWSTYKVNNHDFDQWIPPLFEHFRILVSILLITKSNLQIFFVKSFLSMFTGWFLEVVPISETCTKVFYKSGQIDLFNGATTCSPCFWIIYVGTLLHCFVDHNYWPCCQEKFISIVIII